MANPIQVRMLYGKAENLQKQPISAGSMYVTLDGKLYFDLRDNNVEKRVQINGSSSEDISDIANKLTALETKLDGWSNTGDNNTPVFFDNAGAPQVIDGLDVPLITIEDINEICK